MTDDDIRSNKEILRDEHRDAKERLATLYSTSRRIGEVLQMRGSTLRSVSTTSALPRFKEPSRIGVVSVDGLDVDYLQALMDDIERNRGTITQLEGELRRLHVEFVPFGVQLQIRPLVGGQ